MVFRRILVFDLPHIFSVFKNYCLTFYPRKLLGKISMTVLNF